MWLYATCLIAFPLICPLLSRWILHTWKNIWCIWSSRIRVRCTIWTCCGATMKRTATLARQLMYWPVLLTCTGLNTHQLDNKFYSGRLLLVNMSSDKAVIKKHTPVSRLLLTTYTVYVLYGLFLIVFLSLTWLKKGILLSDLIMQHWDLIKAAFGVYRSSHSVC